MQWGARRPYAVISRAPHPSDSQTAGRGPDQDVLPCIPLKRPASWGSCCGSVVSWTSSATSPLLSTTLGVAGPGHHADRPHAAGLESSRLWQPLLAGQRHPRPRAHPRTGHRRPPLRSTPGVLARVERHPRSRCRRENTNDPRRPLPRLAGHAAKPTNLILGPTSQERERRSAVGLRGCRQNAQDRLHSRHAQPWMKRSTSTDKPSPSGGMTGCRRRQSRSPPATRPVVIETHGRPGDGRSRGGRVML